jgi:hypothetical protein
MELVMSSPSMLLADPVAASSNADSINHDRSDDQGVSAFEDAGLAGLSFAENQISSQSNDAWSVCFMGKGPAFYITNSKEKHRNGDSCFGAVKEGMDVLERMFGVSTVDEDIGFKSAKPVRMVNAILIWCCEGGEGCAGEDVWCFHCR